MKSQYNLKNISKDKPITLLGLALVLSGVLSVFLVPEVTWVDAIPLVALGLGLMPFARKKACDSKEDCNTLYSLAIVVVLLGSGILFPSCNTYKGCQNKFGFEKDTITVRDTLVIKDTVKVLVPPDSAELNLLIDSLLLLDAGSRIEKTSKDGRTTLSVSKSKDNNRLHIKARCNEVNLMVPVQVIYPYEKQTILQNNFRNEPKKGWRKHWNSFKEISAYIVLAGILFLIIRLILKLIP